MANNKKPGTGEKAKPMGGNAEYQRHARDALPLLVEYAQAHQKVSYKELASRLNMPNPRNVNYVLGSVGITLVNLSDLWGEEIPPITTLVVRSGSTLPSAGADIFLSQGESESRTNTKSRKANLNIAIDSVFNYQGWPKVLEALRLDSTRSDAALKEGTTSGTAFLFAWNPKLFPWNDLKDDIKGAHRARPPVVRWSCGNRKDLPIGSEIYLIRLGVAPKGIIGRGVTVSEPEEDEHWDPEKARQKDTAMYVELRFTDLNETPVIPWNELQQPPLARFHWSIFASGVALPGVIADELNRRWRTPKSVLGVPGMFEGPDMLAEHPFANELAPELAILRQADLSVTEKEQLIIARRGQGIFRDNVLRVEPRCRVTGVTDIAHLRASHMKPWSVCSNGERLSENNGLMLAPHVDHLFDQGYISFSDVGDILISSECPPAVLTAWGISSSTNVRPFRVAQRPFLVYHREHVFKR